MDVVAASGDDVEIGSFRDSPQLANRRLETDHGEVYDRATTRTREVLELMKKRLLVLQDEVVPEHERISP